MTRESLTCPTNPFSINSGSHCCACTLPHLCTGICTPNAGGHSLLGNLPLATACKLGQLEIRGRKRCSWIFPPNKKTFPSTWCLSCSVLQLRACLASLELQHMFMCRNQHLSGRLTWAWILDVHLLSIYTCLQGPICSAGQRHVYGHPRPLQNEVGNGALHIHHWTKLPLPPLGQTRSASEQWLQGDIGGMKEKVLSDSLTHLSQAAFAPLLSPPQMPVGTQRSSAGFVYSNQTGQACRQGFF